MVELGSARPKIPRLSYEYFAKQVDQKTNEAVGFVPLEDVFASGRVCFSEGDVVHDVGAGPGYSTEYLQSYVPDCKKKSVIWIASEPTSSNCEQIKTRFGEENVCALNLDAIEAVKVVRYSTKIFFLNGIHMLEPAERIEFFRQSFESLGPRGQLVITSAFTSEAVDEQVQRDVLNPWMIAVFREAKSRGVDLGDLKEGLEIVKKQVWSIDRYRQEILDAGFQPDFFETLDMPCNWETYRRISHYEGWNQRTLPDLKDRQAAVINFTALKKTMRRLGKSWNDPAPRNTLVMVARKPKAA